MNMLRVIFAQRTFVRSADNSILLHSSGYCVGQPRSASMVWAYIIISKIVNNDLQKIGELLYNSATFIYKH